MDKAIAIYSQVLKAYLSTCFKNQKDIDPIILNKERFKVKAIFTASMIFLKSNPNLERYKIVSTANYWLKNTFSNKNIFSSIIESASDELINIIDNYLSTLFEVELIDIPTFYENLLGLESKNENKGTKISNSKNYRNKLGSYYTPAKLAQTVTKKTIDSFFQLNYGIHKLSEKRNLKEEVLWDLTTISFSDFSCGGGNFLIEIINYFDDLFLRLKIDDDAKSHLLKMIALNIHAFDVDCIALEVAKLNLLIKLKKFEIYKELSKNFIHANFLLQSDLEVDKMKRVNVFASGFIYHEQLSINKNKLQKYDIILGNPPWEKIRFEEKKFFALYENIISNNHFKATRKNEIAKSEQQNTRLANFSKQYKYEIGKAKKDLKNNSLFSLSNKGELNTYALFTDAAIKLKTNRGVTGLILKSAIVTSQVNQKLFKFLTKENLTIALYDFINRKKIFNIDSRERFCFLLLGTTKDEKFQVAMNLKEVDEIEKIKPEIEMSFNRLNSLNPITGMLPNFSCKEEADFLLRLSNDFPFFKNEYEGVKFGRIVHLTSHSEYISKKKNKDNIPIYEGKFFTQFDGRYSGFNDVDNELKYGNKSSSVILDEVKKIIADYFPESRFFIETEKWLQLSKNHSEKFMLAWRSLTSATNTRTCIATVLPFIPATQSVQFLTTNQNDLLYMAGLFNSVVFDFILKKKLSGIDLTQSVINQMPIPNFEQTTSIISFNNSLSTIKEHISLLVFSLLKHDIRLIPLFESLNLHQAINESRSTIIRKLDLLFMLLYKLNNLEIDLVLSEFDKQYSSEDSDWFKRQLEKLLSDNTVSPTITTSPTFSPV